MSRKPTNLGLPSPPGGFVGAPIPQTDPTMETLKSMPDKYSSRWFALYDRMPRTNQVKYNHYLLTKLKKKGWTYSGVVGFINQKRRQAESAEKVKESLDELAPPPTSEPVAKQEPRARVPFSVPPDVYQQCQQLKKEIDALFKYTDGVEKFPEIDRKYRRNFFEELEKLRNRIHNECLLRGQVPERKEFFKNMNTLLENMMAEMLADPRYEAIRQARQAAQARQTKQGGKRRTRKQKRKAKGKTRKYHRKKHRKRKTRKSTN